MPFPREQEESSSSSAVSSTKLRLHDPEQMISYPSLSHNSNSRKKRRQLYEKDSIIFSKMITPSSFDEQTVSTNQASTHIQPPLIKKMLSFERLQQERQLRTRTTDKEETIVYPLFNSSSSDSSGQPTVSHPRKRKTRHARVVSDGIPVIQIVAAASVVEMKQGTFGWADFPISSRHISLDEDSPIYERLSESLEAA